MATGFGALQSINRKSGRSPQAAAAYRAGCRLIDGLTGEIHDYRRKGGIVHSEIVAPTGCEWATDRQALWDAAGEADKRSNSTTAREWLGALPHELSHDGRVGVTREFARYIVERHGAAVDANIHAPDKVPVIGTEPRNWHAHVMFTSRAVLPEGMGAKTRQLDVKATASVAVEAMRTEWEAIVNRHLAAEAIEARIAMQSYERRGIHKMGLPKIGQGATALERRGISTAAGDRVRAITRHNDQYRAKGRKLAKELKSTEEEIMRLSQFNKEASKENPYKDSKPNTMGYVVPVKTAKDNRTPEDIETRKQREIRDLSDYYDTDLTHWDVRKSWNKEKYVLVEFQDFSQLIDSKSEGRITIRGAVTDQNINAMVDMVRAKGWQVVDIHGDDDFKARAWLEYSLCGIQVRNYEPPEHVKKQLAELTRNHVTEAGLDKESTLHKKEVLNLPAPKSEPTQADEYRMGKGG